MRECLLGCAADQGLPHFSFSPGSNPSASRSYFSPALHHHNISTALTTLSNVLHPPPTMNRVREIAETAGAACVVLCICLPLWVLTGCKPITPCGTKHRKNMAPPERFRSQPDSAAAAPTYSHVEKSEKQPGAVTTVDCLPP